MHLEEGRLHLQANLEFMLERQGSLHPLLFEALVARQTWAGCACSDYGIFWGRYKDAATHFANNVESKCQPTRIWHL